jgi:alkanesulfonate monooxygenase SsuD/methylene tetrahydromethanopterin reductase-like flavin-dependent oxidoreductase (luciferase family)
MYSIRFDMRAPAFGSATTDLYAAAIDMSSWAEQHGCLAAVLCEHHGSEDGYLPAPLILASAMAARTERLMLSLVVILPFYDPVRLAEDIAVLDIISKGRASYIFGIGYRSEEFEHFGVDRAARGKLADEKLALLRALLPGESVVHKGRRIKVTPSSHTPGGPALMWAAPAWRRRVERAETVWACWRTVACPACRRPTRLLVASTGTNRGRCWFPSATQRRSPSSPTTSTPHGTN